MPMQDIFANSYSSRFFDVCEQEMEQRLQDTAVYSGELESGYYGHCLHLDFMQSNHTTTIQTAPAGYPKDRSVIRTEKGEVKDVRTNHSRLYMALDIHNMRSGASAAWNLCWCASLAS